MKELVIKIRDLCNHATRREILLADKVRWSKLWASMDTIDDTQNAIDTFVKLPDVDFLNGGYLYIYGVLQALFGQQDAVNGVCNTLLNSSLDFKKDYPELYEIREYRNSSIGHPTGRGDNDSFHNISRMSVSKDNLTLASYFPKSGKSSKFTEISISEFIKLQDAALTRILQNVLTSMQSDFDKHVNKFKGVKLSEIIHDDFHYEFGKLSEGVSSDYPLTKMNFDTIRAAYEKIKTGLIERFFSLNALSGIKYTTDMLDYLFERIERTLIMNKISDEKELYIFIDALASNFKELQEMLIEIDRDFE